MIVVAKNVTSLFFCLGMPDCHIGNILLLLRHILMLDLVVGRLLDGKGFAFKAWVVHSIFSADSANR